MFRLLCLPLVACCCLLSARVTVAQESFADQYAEQIERLLEQRFADADAGMVIGLVDEHGSRVFAAG